MNDADEDDTERDDGDLLPSREVLSRESPNLHGEWFVEVESFVNEREQEEEDVLRAFYVFGAWPRPCLPMNNIEHDDERQVGGAAAWAMGALLLAAAILALVATIGCTPPR